MIKPYLNLNPDARTVNTPEIYFSLDKECVFASKKIYSR